MVTPTETTQGIPLTIVEADPHRGSISLIFQETGFSTKALGALQINSCAFNILGPLGAPAVIEKVGTIVCVATGIGTTQILPICRAHKKIGNKVIGIIGAKTKNFLMLEAQMRLSCHKLFIATDDGSYIKRGLATGLLRELLQQEKVHLVYAVGSIDMMQAVAAMTRERQIQTKVSLKPVMIDGTGICGSCRVKVGGRIVLACVEGPEFDGHRIDFEDLKIRMNAFSLEKNKEKEWSSPKSMPYQPINGSGIFRKFLKGIPKSRP
jgi:ferredoxin--NADP+ reductase